VIKFFLKNSYTQETSGSNLDDIWDRFKVCVLTCGDIAYSAGRESSDGGGRGAGHQEQTTLPAHQEAHQKYFIEYIIKTS
jgi:hypothetical protein